ncbi:hypothetical protein [Shimia abyssi]|nr:hypothetical protein [Shimia abyssi]
MGEKNESGLKPANEEPWYVLMTLYEQREWEDLDWELHEKNWRVWNEGLSAEEQESAAESTGIDVAELRGWDEAKVEIADRHALIWKARDGASDYPGRPSVKGEIDRSKTTARIYFATFIADALFASARR